MCQRILVELHSVSSGVPELKTDMAKLVSAFLQFLVANVPKNT
jgi:hypothetical protein